MKIKYFYILAIIIIIIGLSNSLRFTISTGNQPWFEDRFCIDGRNYIKGMISIVTKNDFLNLENLDQSPGYQIYLALVYKFFPDDGKIFKIIKMMSWAISLLTVGLIFYLGEKYFGKYVGALAAILLSFSCKYHVYMNLVQYEVLLGFVLLLYVYFLTKFLLCKRRYAGFTVLFLAGIMASIACLIQARFLYIIPLGFIYIYVRTKSQKMNFKETAIFFLLFILPFLILAKWSVYSSFRIHKAVICQTDLLARFNKYNCLSSKGWAWPLPEKIEDPLGLSFIAAYPAKFLWLIKERFLYLWDFQKDIWYVGNPLINYINALLGESFFEIYFYFMCFISFFIGATGKAIADIKSGLIKTTSSFYFVLLPMLILPLFVFSSSRFLIPVLPFIFLFQAYFIARLIFFIRKLVCREPNIAAAGNP